MNSKWVIPKAKESKAFKFEFPESLPTTKKCFKPDCINVVCDYSDRFCSQHLDCGMSSTEFVNKMDERIKQVEQLKDNSYTAEVVNDKETSYGIIILREKSFNNVSFGDIYIFNVYKLSSKWFIRYENTIFPMDTLVNMNKVYRDNKGIVVEYKSITGSETFIRFEKMSMDVFYLLMVNLRS